MDLPAGAAPPCHTDAEIVIYPIPIAKPRSGSKRKLSADGNSALSSSEAPPSPVDAADSSASPQSVTDCVSYVVETREQRGKFLVERAVALGVPKGKLFGQLHHGKDVTLPDGRVVRSSDCVLPAVPPSGCAIVACPSTNYIDELVASHGFARYQWKSSTDSQDEQMTAPDVQLQVLFHLGDEQVLVNPAYRAWMLRFGPDVEHVALRHPHCPRKTVYRASAKLQAQLNCLFPHAFPSNEEYERRDGDLPTAVMSDDEEATKLRMPRRLEVIDGANTAAVTTSEGKTLVLGESMLRYTMAPLNRRGFDVTRCWDRLDFGEIAASTSALQAEAERSQQLIQESGGATQDVGIRGRITFLGTGCAIPSKYRNVTGMYLELARPCSTSEADATASSTDATYDWVGMMLDCGEGSLGQLYRYAGGDHTRLQELVDRLKCIWVSHNHADHHLGILRMLSCRSAAHNSSSDREGSVEPLLIIGPPHVEFWLREYARLDPTVAGKYTFVDSYLFNDADERFEDDFSIGKPARAMLRETLGIDALDCVPVKHAHLSYALVATFVGGAKIAFSGDCRPSDAFARKARGALLMVHEATFEESMTTEAKQKAHCTTTEAIDVATRAQAKHVALTHFSQRYPKMPVMTSAAAGGEDSPDVLTAIDLLSLDLRALRQPTLSDICSQLMSKDDEEDEDEGDKLEEDSKSDK